MSRTSNSSKTRERVLLGLVVVTGLAFIGQRAYKALFVTPVVELDKKIAEAEKQVDKYNRDLSYGPALERYDARLKQGSLPFDDMLARNMYQTYLNAKLQRYNLAPPSVKVKLGRKAAGDHRVVGANVRAQGKLRDIYEFVHELRSDPLLQRVERFSLKAVGDTPGERFEMALTLSALALQGVKGRDELVQAQADVPGPRPADQELDAYDVIAKVNIFKPYVPPPPVVTPPPPRPPVRRPPPRRPVRKPPPIPGKDLQLAGILLDTALNPTEFVLIIDTRDARKDPHEIYKGQTIPVIDGKLVQIMRDDERIVARIKGRYYVFENGDLMDKREAIRESEFPQPEPDAPSGTAEEKTQPEGGTVPVSDKPTSDDDSDDDDE